MSFTSDRIVKQSTGIALASITLSWNCTGKHNVDDLRIFHLSIKAFHHCIFPWLNIGTVSISSVFLLTA